MHMAATCLHYGQEGFEGLKVYTGKDGKVRLSAVMKMQSGCRVLRIAF
jgi:branched-chain amino acid aminotransferase